MLTGRIMAAPPASSRRLGPCAESDVFDPLDLPAVDVDDVGRRPGRLLPDLEVQSIAGGQFGLAGHVLDGAPRAARSSPPEATFTGPLERL